MDGRHRRPFCVCMVARLDQEDINLCGGDSRRAAQVHLAKYERAERLYGGYHYSFGGDGTHDCRC